MHLTTYRLTCDDISRRVSPRRAGALTYSLLSATDHVVLPLQVASRYPACHRAVLYYYDKNAIIIKCPLAPQVYTPLSLSLLFSLSRPLLRGSIAWCECEYTFLL